MVTSDTSTLRLESSKYSNGIKGHVAESLSSSSTRIAPKDVSSLEQNATPHVSSSNSTIKDKENDALFAVKYPNLAKLAKLDPSIKPDPVALETVKYHIDAIKLHSFSLIEVRWIIIL